MIYLVYFLLVAICFGLIALVDFLFKKLRKNKVKINPKQVVRMPRWSFIAGILVTLIAIVGLLLVPFAEKLIWFGCWVVLIMGIYILVNFFGFYIAFDEEGFTYKTLGKKPLVCRYEEISAQETILAKSGWNSTLYTAKGEVGLTAAMQGIDKFLNKAFFAWCRQKGIDPDTVENNPTILVFFPGLPREEA